MRREFAMSASDVAARKHGSWLVVYAVLICLSVPANSAIIVSNDGGVAMNISAMPR
jgi:hypothetical protein